MNFASWRQDRSSNEFSERMKKRAAILKAVRHFFDEQDFLSVETPTVVRLPGMEPNLDPLKTSVRPQGESSLDAWLITSPEYSLKKILAAGYERIYEITRSYRDGEPWVGGQHNPEFTMLEWYRAEEDYTSLMQDTEQLVSSVAKKINDTMIINFAGRAIDLTPPWPRLTVAAAFMQYANLDLERAINNRVWFRDELRSRGFVVPDHESFDDLFFRLFLRDIEPKLGLDKPTILYDYPASMAALAKLKSDNSSYAERVEVYCAGLELANGFSELINADEQRDRLVSERKERQLLGRADYAIDEDFIEAVREMPKAAGIAFGIDRLVMLLTDSTNIEDVIFLPANALWNKKTKQRI